MNPEFVYLDNNATTPCDPRVIEKMQPYFGQVYGNPATGLHLQGREASRAVETAREQVAGLIGAQAGEVVFTSGATESNNLAILGVARRAGSRQRRRIVTCAVEHKAVLLPCQRLGEMGFEVIVLPATVTGQVALEQAVQAIDSQTLLVSIQSANNEIGTVQPIREIAQLTRAVGAVFHCDAAQAVGKIPVNVDDWDVDLLSMSAHKAYGPKGVGALYLRRGPRNALIEPVAFGGGQEGELRPGTLNVPGIVGFGEACRIAAEELGQDTARVSRLRDRLEDNLLSEIPGLRINGDTHNRLPNTSSLVFPEIDAEALLLNMPHVMMGTGSACTSGAPEPSHVLQAIGLTRSMAQATVRASLGRFTSMKDIDWASGTIVAAYQSLRSGVPVP